MMAKGKMFIFQQIAYIIAYHGRLKDAIIIIEIACNRLSWPIEKRNDLSSKRSSEITGHGRLKDAIIFQKIAYHGRLKVEIIFQKIVYHGGLKDDNIMFQEIAYHGWRNFQLFLKRLPIIVDWKME